MIGRPRSRNWESMHKFIIEHSERYWREQIAQDIETIELHSSDSYILTALIAVKDKAAAIARGKTE